MKVEVAILGSPVPDMVSVDVEQPWTDVKNVPVWSAQPPSPTWTTARCVTRTCPAERTGGRTTSWPPRDVSRTLDDSSPSTSLAQVGQDNSLQTFFSTSGVMIRVATEAASERSLVHISTRDVLRICVLKTVFITSHKCHNDRVVTGAASKKVCCPYFSKRCPEFSLQVA